MRLLMNCWGGSLKAELPERILHRDLEASDRAEQQLVVVFKEYSLGRRGNLGIVSDQPKKGMGIQQYPHVKCAMNSSGS